MAARPMLETLTGCWAFLATVHFSSMRIPRLIFIGFMSSLQVGFVVPLIARSANIFAITGTNFIPHPTVNRTMRLLITAPGTKSKTKPAPSSSSLVDSANPATHVESSASINLGLKPGIDFSTKGVVNFKASKSRGLSPAAGGYINYCCLQPDLKT